MLGLAQKVGINAEGTVAKTWTKLDAAVNHWDIDKTAKQMNDIGQETGEKLRSVDDAVAEKIKNKEALKNAYKEKLKEARSGNSSSAKEAASGGREPNVVNEAVNLNDLNQERPFRFTMDKSEGGDVYSRIENKSYNADKPIGKNNNQWIYNRNAKPVDVDEFTLATNIHNSYGGKFTNFDEIQQIAENTSKTSPLEHSGIFSTIGGMVQDHPFISAGIAGGAGILGANLFDDDNSGY